MTKGVKIGDSGGDAGLAAESHGCVFQGGRFFWICICMFIFQSSFKEVARCEDLRDVRESHGMRRERRGLTIQCIDLWPRRCISFHLDSTMSESHLQAMRC